MNCAMKRPAVNKLLVAFATVAGIGSILLAAASGRQCRRLQVDGREVRMLLAGDRGPTVVFESGAGSSLETWVRIQPEVARFARTISYDRAGTGLSSQGAVPRDARNIAAELHANLQAAQAVPPYVLVGHSLGGPYLRVFAAMFPDEVAGVILVDPTQEDLVEWAKARKSETFQNQNRPYDEGDCAFAALAQARESRLPERLPVTLISGMGPREIPGFVSAKQRAELMKDQETLWPMKLKFHREWVEKLPKGQLVVTEKSGHGIPFEEPELVIAEIRRMVAGGDSRLP